MANDETKRPRPEVWAVVIDGMARGLERLYQDGAATPEHVVGEARRLIDHPNGCPEDVKTRLEKLEWRAAGELRKLEEDLQDG